MKNRLGNASYLLFCLLAFLPFAAGANKDLSPAQAQAIARIVKEYDGPHKPALALALLKDGKVVYQKAFGKVHLDYDVPATVDTKFQVDALAWEFIAAATFMLADQGKLALDDDVRKYLPEIPDFGKKISINHLLNSTDGLYGNRIIKSLAGWEAQEAQRFETVLPFIKEQKTLNFNPGESFSPGGDTRLILLMKIVERASGLSFDAYCKSHIFSPLKMSNTLFFNEHSGLLNNVAMPYATAANGAYRHLSAGANAAAPIQLYTSVRDLSLWRSALSSPASDKKFLADRLNLPIRLDRGALIRDISGISTYGQQRASKERGIPKVYRTGSAGGYASSLFHFPEQNVTAIALSSGLAYNGNYAMRIASVLLETHFTEPETIDYSKIAGVKLSTEQLRRHAGHYWNPLRAIAARIHVNNDVLHYSRIEGADGRAAIPLSEAAFQLRIEGDDVYSIKFVETKKGKHLHFMMGESDPIVFESYTPVSYTETALAEFAGTFYSKELNSSFVLDARRGVLTAENIRTGSVTFKPITADLFSGNRDFMGSIKFSRGKNNAVTGFRIMVDEVRHLEFLKMHDDAGTLRRLSAVF